MIVPAASSASVGSLKTPVARPPENGAPQDTFAPGYPEAYLDRSVRPQDDFYQFATGGLQRATAIPDDKSSWGTYTQLRTKVNQDLQGILEDTKAQTNTAPGSPDQLVGDFYASAMDVALADATGYKPLQPFLDQVAGIRSTGDVQKTIAEFHRVGLSAVFSFESEPDPKNPDEVIAGAGQSGMGLPSKDYYTNPSHQAQRDAYVQYARTLFTLVGDDPQTAAHEADAAMRVETRLAQGAMSPAELRDPQKTYNPMQRQDLSQMSPDFDWSGYLKTLGRPDIQKVDVSTVNFFKNLSGMMQQVPVEDWQSYLRLQLLNQTARLLSTPFVNARFTYQQALSGVPQQPARWKEMASLTDGVLGDAVGQKYVARYFTPEAKAVAREMIDTVRTVLRDKIEKSWMSAPTREQALKKIDHLKVNVGYPDKWETYAGLSIDRGSLIENMLRVKAWKADKDRSDIGQPRDRDRWFTTPSTVNAFYNPSDNSITFPAARLQPPLFDPKQDMALNYGSTGVTMGHEMTHGFDDSGCHYDEKGALRDWWQPEDMAAFQKVADGVQQQFSEYEYLGEKVNGKLVEGESLADLGGVELGYEAFEQALKKKGGSHAPGADGFTSEQRLCLGYALVREETIRPEAAKLQIATDPHPLGQFRVNGPFSNFGPFYEAWQVAPEDAMRRPAEKRNHLWNAPNP